VSFTATSSPKPLPNQGAIKILDFGLARFKPGFEQNSGSQTVTLTGTNLLVGTIPYLSPEQVRGEAVTAATDIFSLGCVLYEMVTGRRAFRRSTPASTIAAILNDEPAPVAQDVEDVPAELDRWITNCLKKDRGCDLNPRVTWASS